METYHNFFSFNLRPRYFATETNYIVENEERVSLEDYEDCPVDEIEAGQWDILQWAVKVFSY